LNHSFEILIQIFSSVVKAHIIIILLLVISWLLERYAGLKLFIYVFRYKNNPSEAKMFLNTHTVYYFIINLLTFVFTDKGKYFVYNFNTLSAYFLLIFPLLLIFRKLHSKYQGIDELKSEDDKIK